MESAITSKGQATIPKEIREHLGLKPGDRVKFFIHPDGHVVMLPKLPISALRGILKSRLKRAPTIEEMDDAIAAGAIEFGDAAKAAMIGLDSNILLRYLLQDDPIQSPRASSYLTTRLTEDNPGFVSVVALVKIVWVLERRYRFATAEIAEALERMLAIDTLVIESEREVFRALTALKAGQGTFADALVAALSEKAGCAHTVTFDRGALRLPGFAPV